MADVKFGVHVGPQHCTMAEMTSMWARAEELGFDWISTFDHLYAAVYPQVGGPCFEALTSHAALAALTTRARVGCLVYCAPFRHPALLASAGATIDHLSGGRLEMGIGAGWLPVEQEAIGIGFEAPAVRLRRLAETVEIMRSLWAGGPVDYAGEFYTLRGAVCDPCPIQQPPRIWIGAAGEHGGLQLAGRLADGWNLVMPAPDVFARKLETVRDAAPEPDRLAVGVNIGLIGEEHDEEIEAAIRIRYGEAIDVIRAASAIGSTDRMIEHVQQYVDAGAEWIVLAVRAPFDLDALQRFAEEVVPAIRSQRSAGVGAGD